MLPWLSKYIVSISNYVVHLVTVATAAWYWWQHSILKDVLEDKLERRHTMGNPVADLKLALTILAEVHQDLPVFAQGLLDIKQAWADKADPVKTAADLDNFLTDNEPLLTRLVALAPAVAPAATTSAS